MNIKEFKLGTRIEIEMINSRGNKIGKSYISQLIDITDNQNITIAAPIWESKLMLIPSNTKIRCILFDEKKGLYSFTGLILSREKNENIISFHTSIGSDIEKIQRRNYYRLECSIDVEYSILESDQTKSGHFNIVGKPKKALSRNISGSGVSIVTDEELPEGTFIKVTLYLTELTSLTATTNIVRCRRLDIPGPQKYELGLYISEISKKDHDVLLKYIYDKQRAQLKNNMGRG